MKKCGLILLCLLLTCSGYSQSVFELVQTESGKVIVMPRQKMRAFNFEIPEYIYKSYIPIAPAFDMDVKLNEFTPDIHTTHAAERPMDMQIISKAYQPFYNIYTPMLRRVSPMAFDFRETTIVPLDEKTSFYATGTQYTWPGAGGITTLNAGVAWHSDRWTLSGGGFGGRYFTPFNLSPAFMTGVNTQVRYDATDWLSVRGWGQYTYYQEGEKYNPHMLLNPNYNHTSAGGAVELYLNDNFGVGMGINYEFNPWKRKMEPQYLVYPIFRRK